MLAAEDAVAGLLLGSKFGQVLLPGLFAAGDCTGGPLQVSKAAGEGLVAGQSAAAYAAALARNKK